MINEPDYAGVAELLGRSRLLRAVELEDRERLARQMGRESYPAGGIVFEKDAPGDALYFVLTGRVRIFTSDPLGHDLTLRTYGPGDVFGEFAVLDGKPRSASAQADGALEVLRLGRDEFLRFLDTHPLAGLAMMRGMVERVRYTTDYLQQVMAALDLLSIGDYDRALKAVPESASDAAIQRLIDAFMDLVRRVQGHGAQRW
ncbi:MAG TPA: cyclic nucleotide-binding domain-containing protein [Aggregatilinea sp.]|jgi:CRP-like cAMP-binding protein|uniref:Crp/Fnr family transcriptional regulator n=1 Tax=Aggregatilinea sp. TaxID=2806333 RepID=UPI002BB9AFD4|nr:cyclic nucleotide-binding domain-containing protein [Aggregatilinea sp.]HML24470.1 cyclic nucleotide-binding domain-containing protein [Aggregatilinea sp.]